VGNQSDPVEFNVKIGQLAITDLALITDQTDGVVTVGAETIPAENITEAVLAVAESGTPVDSTPLSSIPLSSIPLSSIPLSSIPLSSIPLSSIPLSSIDTVANPLSSIPLSSIVLSAPLSSIPLSSILLSEIEVDLPGGEGTEGLLVGTPLSSIPLNSITLDEIMSLPLSSIDWATSPLNSIPLSSIPLSSICSTCTTVEDLYDEGLVDEVGDVLTFENVDFGSTPLSSIPLASIVFGSTPLSSIPLSSIGGTPVPLAEWCVVLGLTGADCTWLEDEDPSLMALAFTGIDFSSIPLSSIPLSSIDWASTPLSSIPLSSINWLSTPLSSIPLSSIDWASTPLSSIPLSSIDWATSPLSSIPLSSIDWDAIPLSSISCSGCVTLGDAIAAGELAGVTLGELAPGLPIEALLGDLGAYLLDDTLTLELLEGLGELGFSIADLLYALLPPAELPWLEVDLSTLRATDAAFPEEPDFTYFVDFTVDEGIAAEVLEVTIDLPPGFAYARFTVSGDPGPASTFDLVEVADPSLTVIDDGTLYDRLTFALTDVQPGPHQLAFRARAGITLGESITTASIAASAAGGTQTASAGPATTSLTVDEALEGGPQATSLLDEVRVVQDEVLNLAHVSRSGDYDLYQFDIAPDLVGSSVDILLSNLPVDLDLGLYGPPREDFILPAVDQQYSVLADVPFDLTPASDVLQTDTLQDVPQDPVALGLNAGTVLHAISAKRGTNDEEIKTGSLRGGTYYILVSSYNGSFSDLPYALQIRSEPGEAIPLCGAGCPLTYHTQASNAGVPDPNTLDYTGINTLFLYNQLWLQDTYPGSETGVRAGSGQAVIDELLAIAGATTIGDAWRALGVNAQAVAVDGDALVFGKLQDWNNDRYNPAAANDVVREIARLVNELAAKPGADIQYVVVVGDDGQIPFARVPDGTWLSNERTHWQSVSDDLEISWALRAGMYLTDDAYGASQSIRVNDHELFIAERAVGRLVETPDQILAQLGNFASFNGRLDPATGSLDYVVSGYDFLTDGSTEVAAALEASLGGTADSTLISDTWTSSELDAKLEAGQLDVISLNAHFDQSRLLPADQNLAGTENELYDVTMLPLGIGQSLVFSMGCHAGLSTTDVRIGVQSLDWAQGFADRADVFAGNSGYGYGETELVMLSEKLSVDFADRLGQLSIGQAWRAAKSSYAQDLWVISPYDEKILQEFVLYGLPMFVTGRDVTVGGAAAAAASTEASVLPTVTDPFTGLQVSFEDFTFPIVTGDPSFFETPLQRVDTADGSYYHINGEVLGVRGRPVQPFTSRDITRANGLGGLEDVAAGALITDFSSTAVSPFSAFYFSPVVDTSDEARLEFGDATFPAGIARITTGLDDAGAANQQINLVPGRYVFGPTPESGTQELVNSLTAEIYYNPDPTADYPVPFIHESIGRVGDGLVHFEVDVSDAVRVLVTYRAEGTLGAWQNVDLVNAGGDAWLGGEPVVVSASEYEFFVQAVGPGGDVAMSNFKGLDFTANAPAPVGVVNLELSGAVGENGWFVSSTVTATATVVNGGGLEQITAYVLDGVVTLVDPAATEIEVTVSGEGGHILQVFTASGNVAFAFVAIDSVDPVATAEITTPLTNGWSTGSVEVSITASDVNPPVPGSGVASITYQLPGAPEVEVESADITVTAAQSGTLTYYATDYAGNSSAPQTLEIQIDGVAPVVSASLSGTLGNAGYYTSDVTVSLSADDGAAGSGVASIEYSFDGSSFSAYPAGGVVISTQGSTTVYYRASDVAGNTSDVG
jgi:hypothetical protein